MVAAYEQLLAEGYAAARGGSGTYVSEDLSGVAELRRLSKGAYAARARLKLAQRR